MTSGTWGIDPFCPLMCMQAHMHRDFFLRRKWAEHEPSDSRLKGTSSNSCHHDFSARKNCRFKLKAKMNSFLMCRHQELRLRNKKNNLGGMHQWVVSVCYEKRNTFFPFQSYEISSSLCALCKLNQFPEDLSWVTLNTSTGDGEMTQFSSWHGPQRCFFE